MTVNMIDFTEIETLTFDCYGTLINWENGILSAVKPVLESHNIALEDEKILELYAELESEIEKEGYIRYREVMRKVMEKIGEKLGFHPLNEELNCLVNSLKDWKPFPDTVESLKLLKRRYKLVIISNVDDDLFSLSQKHLEVEFDWVITAEQVGSYKPSLNNFRFAIERIGNPDKILHVAQSLYHDIVPAKKLGINAVWVNRRKGKTGSGATPYVEVTQELKPDLEVANLKELCELIEGYLGQS